MSYEAADWISQLDPSNPPGSDPKAQGDDHIRSLKRALTNTFLGAVPGKTFAFPSVAATVGASGPIAASAQNSAISVTTSGGVVNLVLPSLSAAQAGWECSITKVDGLLPMFVLPPSGTLISGEVAVSAARRCFINRRFRVLWSGGVFYVERCIDLPVGSIIDIGMRGALPIGFEWAAGQVLTAASYPEYAQVMGSLTLPDRRGRVAAGRDNMNGVSAGLIGVVPTDLGTINGGLVGSAGGSSTHVLTNAEMPLHSHGLVDPGHDHTVTHNAVSLAGGALQSGGSAGSTPGATIDVQSASTGISIQSAGGGGAHALLQPTVIANMVVVVE